jgi:hypothetical protein
MSAVEKPPAAAQPKRRFLRFSLRTFVVVVALLGVGFGLAGNFWRRVQQQRAIVAQIEAAGGWVNYDYEFGMGADFEHELEGSPRNRHSVVYGETEDERQKRRWVDDSGAEFEEVETPPGPEWLRRHLGDDAFASIEQVDFAKWYGGESSEPIGPAILRSLPSLKILRLVSPQLSDQWLAFASELPQLRVLWAHGDEGDVSVQGMAHLAKAPQLQSLAIGGSCFNDEILRPLGELRHLRILGVTSSENVTSGMLAHIGDDNRLRELVIMKCEKFDDRGTEHLRRLKHVKELWLFSCPISDETLRHISGLQDLEILMLGETKVSDSGMEHLGGLHKLRWLNLLRTQVSDAGLESLLKLDELEYLNLGGTKVTNAGLPAIAELTRLNHLDLSGTNITDEGLIYLRSLQNLKYLNIGPHVSKEAANELRRALPNCRVTRFDENGSGTSMME